MVLGHIVHLIIILKVHRFLYLQLFVQPTHKMRLCWELGRVLRFKTFTENIEARKPLQKKPDHDGRSVQYTSRQTYRVSLVQFLKTDRERYKKNLCFG